MKRRRNKPRCNLEGKVCPQTIKDQIISTNTTPETALKTRQVQMPAVKRIALIAHDNQKPVMLEWARFNRETLSRHLLFATGTTGWVIGTDLDLPVTRLRSGPLGGDQQIGAAIIEGRIDILIFFWDPLEPQPHDVDVKALLRIAALYNVPVACNRSTADFIIASPLMAIDYEQITLDP